MIQSLSQEVTEDLCAQQVITSLTDSVKQLVDNSIDAGATKIDISLKDYGKKAVIVGDNGCGIGDFQFLGKKGSTSKNKEGQHFGTLGFRGEALHSLAKVSQAMHIISTVKGQDSVKLDLKTMEKKVLHPPWPEGTTVSIQSLFQLLPVRRYELLSMHKEQLRKIDQLIREYCLVFPNISFCLKNTREGKQELLIQASIISDSGSFEQRWRYRLGEILGSKLSQAMLFVKTPHIEGWILKNIESGSSRQNSFIRKNIHCMYLNKRPIDPLPKLQSTLNEIYKKYNKNTKYAYVLDLVLPHADFDVNLAPNKREILIKENLLNMIVEELREFVQRNVTCQIAELKPSRQEEMREGDRMRSFLNQDQTLQKKSIHAPQVIGVREGEDQKIFRPPSIKIEKSVADKKDIGQQRRVSLLGASRNSNGSLLQSLNERMSKGKKRVENGKDIQKSQIETSAVKQHSQQKNSLALEKKGNNLMEQQSSSIVEEEPRKSLHLHATQNKKPEGSRSQNPIQAVTQDQRNLIKKQSKQDSKQSDKQGSNIDDFPQQLKDRLAYSLKKEDFDQFSVLGQFNRGFIVCYHQQQFYLVDQHAASQKQQFQSLMSGNRGLNQVCQKITLSPIQMDKLQEHELSLKQDGYSFTRISKDEIVLDKVPNFLGKLYGSKTFIELIDSKSKLEDQPEYYMAAASKACRKAVMVGDVLQKKDMVGIVKDLSKLASPWNCPHGRPTLISLGSKPHTDSSTKPHSPYSLL